MYTARQKEMRRCKKLRKDGERCRAYARLDGEFCTLHSTYDPHRKRPKKGAERKASKYRRDQKRAGKQRRAVCNCEMLPYPHRFSSSGDCPDAPVTERKGGNSERPVSDEQRESRTERTYER